MKSYEYFNQFYSLQKYQDEIKKDIQGDFHNE